MRNANNKYQLHGKRSVLDSRGEKMQNEIMDGQIGMDLGIEDVVKETERKQIEDLSRNIRVRKLTPRECWRLMAFSNCDYEAAEKINSNSQLYKQAGNSICVNVLEAIFGQMFEGKEDHWKRWLEEKCFEDNN